MLHLFWKFMFGLVDVYKNLPNLCQNDLSFQKKQLEKQNGHQSRILLWNSSRVQAQIALFPN